ncbi:molybdopterin-dependent oxidoreductase [Jhaorihella thermophila]
MPGLNWKVNGIDKHLVNAPVFEGPLFEGPLLHGGKDFSPITYEERKAVPSACYQCVTRCPIVGYVENGKLEKISPQYNSIRTEGTLWAKAQAGVNHVYDPDRILYPLRRVGKRGEGKWKRISWDEALDEIAARLKKLRDEGTPEKFMFHYGRMKSSTSKMVKSVFLATYGTGTIGNHTAICEGSKWVAQELTWGGHYDNWDFDNTQFILNFGSNVYEAHTNHNPVAHRLTRAVVERNLRMVTFDVRLSNTAAKSWEWVPIKPGTDIAVILAMCNVIMSEDIIPIEGRNFLRFCRVTKDVNASTDEKDRRAERAPEGLHPEMGRRHQRRAGAENRGDRPRACDQASGGDHQLSRRGDPCLWRGNGTGADDAVLDHRQRRRARRAAQGGRTALEVSQGPEGKSLRRASWAFWTGSPVRWPSRTTMSASLLSN